ncbi:MAG: long-chain fatty acid--CoA ligase, partial [Alphaproteobacteria bacterium]|nr:long-chain fatty acid--CoA ligase [Alphaproteobacteria bacterium]
KHDAEHKAFLDAEIAKGKGADISIIAYTSGTTGRPKGVMISFDNLIVTSRLSSAFDKLKGDDDILSYMPPAWVGDHYFSYAQAYTCGFTVNCPESAATVGVDLREIGPTYYFAPPRIWEGMLTQITVRMHDASLIKQKMVDFFVAHARKVGVRLLEGKSVGLLDRLLYAAGETLVYGPLKNVMGLSRVRLAYTAGEALGPDIFNFYRAIGINLKQLYGQTESSVYITIQSDNDVRADTVGPPAPEVEVKIDEHGEILYRCPGVFVGYYKNEEATKTTKTADGWVHAGDAGIFTTDGHLKIIDRVKDVGRLKGGGLFAPKYIENKLKFFPHILEAVAHGADRDFVTAFINIDMGAVGAWAEKRNIAYASYADLAGRPEVYALIRQAIEQVNRDLAADPDLAQSQIRRFLILHKELDPDDGEITRTRKVRRNVVGERYARLIEALYAGEREVKVEAKVTFEDGRSGVIRANLGIEDAVTFPAAEAARKAG